ncbi:MAG: type II toxin-antitoxin system HicA family toxin [Vulcanimicrobiaceae bacterium]|jgi:predicted RNA binding protein YcfA (HicA-like mRNA interferase family)
MSKAPSLSGRRLLRALLRAGFVEMRVAGSHHLIRHPDGRATTVPVHGSRDLPIGTLHRILRDVRMKIEELAALL